MVLAAKRSGRAVSQMLEIHDGYLAFCIDEAAGYVEAQLKSGAKPLQHVSNQELAQSLEKGRW